jgi:hypothetical protein
MPSDNRVILIVDRSYGDKLREFGSDLPVWIVDSAINRPVIRDQWRASSKQGHLEGITLFNDTPASSPEEVAEKMLKTIEEHHGVHSHDPAFSILEVIGVARCEYLVAPLKELVFSLSAERPMSLEFRRDSSRTSV